MSTESSAPEGTTPAGSTRREVLRRAGLVAGAGTVAWAAPSITTLGSAAFAAGTEGAAFASARSDCGPLSSTTTSTNTGLRTGTYSNFVATFPSLGAGVDVERVVTLDGLPREGTNLYTQTVTTTAGGVATGYTDVKATIPPDSFSQGEIMFTALGGSGQKVVLIVNLTNDCG